MASDTTGHYDFANITRFLTTIDILNVVRGIMGDYAVNAAIDTFMASKFSQHTTDIAMLQGARLVTASETDNGREWAEARIKQMTGGDPITARFMRRDNFTYQPQFKLLIVGNHKPALRTVDEATKRRFRLIPFVIKPEHPDTKLEEKLKEEWPAILRWMIEGCLLWQSEGLQASAQVNEATAAYFDEQDTIAQWLNDECNVVSQDDAAWPSTRALSSKLFTSWANWCAANGETAGTNKNLSQELERRGFGKQRTSFGMEFKGLELK